MGYDVTNKQSFEEIKSFWFNKIEEKTKANLIYLLGNKIDLKDNIEVNENEVKEFTELNKIKYFSISVKDDINIQNVIDDIKINIENINNNINNGINEIIYGNPSKESYKIMLIGESGVGAKTSFFNVVVKNKYDPYVQSTFSASYGSKEIILKNGKKIILNFWDTAGQQILRKLTNIYLKNSDCIILGYEINRSDSFKEIVNYLYPTSKEISGANLFYLIGNKVDLYDDAEVSKKEVREYAKKNNLRFFFISCEKFIGIKEFLEDITDELIKI